MSLRRNPQLALAYRILCEFRQDLRKRIPCENSFVHLRCQKLFVNFMFQRWGVLTFDQAMNIFAFGFIWYGKPFWRKADKTELKK